VKSEPGGGTCIEVDVVANAKEPPNVDIQAHTYSGS
jgi:hypothetical protein